MGDSEEQEPYCPNEYNTFHFLRNVCSPTLAELLAKEIKNSKFIKTALNINREGTLNKTLYEILKNVSSKGKRNASKKNKQATEKSDGASKTQHIINLDDNKDVLNQVKVYELMHEDEVHEKSRVVKTLGDLDLALLLNILTNDVLEFPLLDIEEDLNILKDNRNSIFHKDNYSKKDVRESLWEAVGSIYKYLGKDIANLKEKKRRYFCSSLSSCCPIMKELQQEIHKNYSDNLPHHNSSMQQLTVKHLRKDCQSDEIVEDLAKFLKDQRKSGNQEPQPILLCGAQGAGKSSILHSLVHSFIHSQDFLLVVLLDENKSSSKNKESFWKHVYYYLMDLSPQTVERHSQEKVMTVLENFSSRFLFLWDLNLQDTRNPLSHMDQGTWVLSHQGLPEYSTTNCCVLKVASLLEKQVCQILYSISSSDEHFSQVLECYKKCEYKRFIKSPDMVRIFHSVCLEMTDCVPFYKLIQKYINNKIKRPEENHTELIKLGEKAFDTIRHNRKYYSRSCLADMQKNVFQPFLEHSSSRGYFFKYRVVEDYLAALYIVDDPETACALWLEQATLFKRVFEIVCALWCERGESIRTNLHFVRAYLEKIFEISKPKQNKAKRQKNKQAVDVDEIKDDDSTANKNKDKKAVKVHGVHSIAKKQKNKQAMEVDSDDDSRTNNQNNKQTMEVDEQVMEDVEDKDDETKAKEQKNKQAMKVEEDGNDYTKENDFARWIFLSKFAKEHQNNLDILQLLADLLTRKHTWLFKCKLLKEVIVDNISLVLRHINLTKKLTIRLESGPNVTILSKLWKILCSHQGLCYKTMVHLVIHHTGSNWVMHEKLLAKLPSMIAKTKAPLHITGYVGPLLCSSTPHFLKCLCMARLERLDVCVYDLASLREVLAHQQHSLVSVIVKLNLKMEEQMSPITTQLQFFSCLPLTLTITYFENLQRLLDNFEPPGFLNSLKIYDVYIHEYFKLDLTRFTKMKSLYIRFADTEKSEAVYLEASQSEDKMEVSGEDDIKIPSLPVNCWTLNLVLNLHLPAHLKRFMMRNLSFCDDSNISLLHRYWEGLPLERLTLLDTHLSLSKFKIFLDNCLEDIRVTMEKKFKLDGFPTSSKSVVKQERLKKEEREERRKNKPEGKELIISNEAKFCEKCRCLSCTCVNIGITHSRDTYEDLASLAKEVYSYEILSINYSGKGIVVRKDMCGDMQVQCPLPFLDDDRAQHPEGHPELGQVLEALALAQIICLSHTQLSHSGAIQLIDHLKKKKESFGPIEPFRLTILSHHYHNSCMSKEEMQHSYFMRKIKDDGSLQQFNFKCDCCSRCHNFKKAIKGQIFFNDNKL